MADGSDDDNDDILPLYALIWHDDLARVERQLTRYNIRDPSCSEYMTAILLFRIAIRENRVNHAALLVKAGVDVNRPGLLQQSDTTLSIALAAYSSSTVKIMLDAGAKVNQDEFDGIGPLQHAASHHNLESMKLLVAAGANVNARDLCTGRLPLHVAHLSCFYEGVKFLLRAGADIHARNYDEESVIDVGCRAHSDILTYLWLKGAKLHKPQSKEIKKFVFGLNHCLFAVWALRKYCNIPLEICALVVQCLRVSPESPAPCTPT
jgi:hypothetical protein